MAKARQNGSGEAKSRVEQAQEVEAASAGVRAAFQGEQESLKGQYLERLVNSELDGDKKDILANLLSRDWVLGNLTDEQVHEIKWELRIMREQFFAMYPDQDSGVTGSLRAFVHDKQSASLDPLTQQERHEVDQFFRGVWMRVSRASDMKQQELMATSISESYVQRGDTADGDGGIIGRLKS